MSLGRDSLIPSINYQPYYLHYTGFSQFIPLVSLATVENATSHPLDICYHSEHILGLKQLLILLYLPIADS